MFTTSLKVQWTKQENQPKEMEKPCLILLNLNQVKENETNYFSLKDNAKPTLYSL